LTVAGISRHYSSEGNVNVSCVWLVLIIFIICFSFDPYFLFRSMM
jgi:hypothetical protein